MDGKLISRLELWIGSFAASATSVSGMLKLSEFIWGIRREDWISIAWEVFDEVNTIVRRNNYPVMPVLSFTLKSSDHKMRRPSCLSVNILDKYISPCIIITRLLPETYIMENQCLRVDEYKTVKSEFLFYYSQYQSYSGYRRSIDVLPIEYHGTNAERIKPYHCCDPKAAYLIESWLHDFVSNPSANLEMDDIDYFIPMIRREDWLVASWDIYGVINKMICRNRYHVDAVLSFILKCSRAKRNVPVKLTTSVLHKYTPPGIKLTRYFHKADSLDGRCSCIPEYSEDHSGYVFHYSQYWCDGYYNRSIDVALDPLQDKGGKWSYNDAELM